VSVATFLLDDHLLDHLRPLGDDGPFLAGLGQLGSMPSLKAVSRRGGAAGRASLDLDVLLVEVDLLLDGVSYPGRD